VSYQVLVQIFVPSLSVASLWLIILEILRTNFSFSNVHISIRISLATNLVVPFTTPLFPNREYYPTTYGLNFSSLRNMVNPWPMMGSPYYAKYPTIVQPNSSIPPQPFLVIVAIEIIAMEKDDGKPSNLDDFLKEEQRNSTTKHPQQFFSPNQFLAITKHVMSNNPPRVVTPLGGENGPPQGGNGPMGSKRPSRKSGPRGGRRPIKGKNEPT
jgi:hypothetical protein